MPDPLTVYVIVCTSDDWCPDGPGILRLTPDGAEIDVARCDAVCDDGPHRVMVMVPAEAVRGLVAACEIFGRLADMMEPLDLPDHHPLNECAPRAWVHLKHARDVRVALAALPAALRETP